MEDMEDETHGPDDEVEDVNERIIARLSGYAEANEDDEAVRWLADCLTFCQSEAAIY